jgi:hypothetical protein
MAKRTRTRKNILKKTLKRLDRTTKKLLPKVEVGLETIGKKVRTVAKRSAPMVRKSLSGMYGFLKSTAKKTMRKTRRHRKH